ncbi:MAG: pyruvate kinase [Simkaniaceae bacterium]|nr:pyruvate kinase [Simkaniaceae bacterium]
MLTRTKVICTIGPAVSDYKTILKLIDAGMNVARLNFSHGSHASHLESIQKLMRAREEKGVPLAIMLDTKGPEIRIGMIEGHQIHVVKGQRILLRKDPSPGNEKELPLTPPSILDDLEVKMKVLIDDGYILAQVVAVTPQGVVIEIKNDGLISSQKGVNIPHGNIQLPALTEQDIEDITFGCKHGVDLIAASFVRSAEHMLQIKDLLFQIGHPEVKVIAKIESADGVAHFDSILPVSNGIMVARGDLGVEVPLTQVPKLQKQMIRKSNQSFKPVVTATQMLESMIHAPLPTRAEISDVANAIYDSTTAVMLSGETAVGKYPLDAVKIMKSTIEEAEKDVDYAELFYNSMSRLSFNNIASSIALACVKTAYSAKASAIFVFTNSGHTACAISRFRPAMPIVAVTANQKVYHQLSLQWGVIPLFRKVKDAREGFHIASCFAVAHKLVRYGDIIAVSAGAPFGISGTTNMIMVDNIGEVLVRGMAHRGEKPLSGEVVIIHDSTMTDPVEGKIVVITKCDPSYDRIFKEAQGVILQNYPEDAHSERDAKVLGKKYGRALLLRADGASDLLKPQQVVTLDLAKGIVFKGDSNAEEEFLNTCQNYH